MPATIEKLSETLQRYEPISEEHKMFKQTLSLHLDNESDSPDEECVENILMDLDTEFVFNIKTLKGPKTLHRIFYQFLEIKGVEYDQEKNGRCILSNLAVTMTDDKDILSHIFTNIDIHRRFNGVSNPVNKQQQLIVAADSTEGSYFITTPSARRQSSHGNNRNGHFRSGNNRNRNNGNSNNDNKNNGNEGNENADSHDEEADHRPVAQGGNPPDPDGSDEDEDDNGFNRNGQGNGRNHRNHGGNRQDDRQLYNQRQKKASNMSSRFRKEDKFKGTLEEVIHEAFDCYEEATTDFELDEEEKLKYLHNLFTGEAIRYFRSKVFNQAPDYESAKQLMINEYNSRTRQNRVRKMLQGLRLSQIMEEKKIPANEALEKLKDTISKHAPNGPENHRGDSSLKEYLEQAVVGNDWARTPLMQSEAEAGWNFTRLYTALDAAYLQHQREEEAKKRDCREGDETPTVKTEEIPEKQHGIHYAGQGMYGRPKKPGSSSSRPDIFQRYMKPLKRCFKCGSKDHLIRDCGKNTHKIHHTIAKLWKRGEERERILYQLFTHLEELVNFNQQENESSSSDSDQDSEKENNHVNQEEIDPMDF